MAAVVLKLGFALLWLVTGVRKAELQSNDHLQAVRDFKSGGTVAALQALQKEGVTPGVKAAIEKAMTSLQTEVMPQIERDHGNTVAEVVRMVRDLKDRSSEVDTLHEEVEVARKRHYTCMTGEKDIFIRKGEAWDAYQAVKGSDVVPCAEMEANNAFNGTIPALGFECSLKTGDCASKMGVFGETMTSSLDELSNALDEKSKIYNAAKLACGNAKTAIKDAVNHFNKLVQTYAEKVLTCEAFRKERDAEMCSGLARGLKHQCSSLDAYKALVADIGKVDGGIYSHPDRVKEYKAALTAHCVMEKFLHDITIDSETASACANDANLETNIGTVPLLKEDVDALINKDKEHCMRPKIQFGKHMWLVSSTYYETDRWTPVLTDDKSFELCDQFFNVEAEDVSSTAGAVKVIPYKDLKVGDLIFTDRGYRFKSIGNYDSSCSYVSTPNAAQNTPAGEIQTQIEINKPSAVYLDFWSATRYKGLELGFKEWGARDGWTVSDKVGITFPYYAPAPGKVMMKKFEAGTVKLMGNDGSLGKGLVGTYLVFVCPLEEA